MEILKCQNTTEAEAEVEREEMKTRIGNMEAVREIGNMKRVVGEGERTHTPAGDTMMSTTDVEREDSMIAEEGLGTDPTREEDGME